MGIVLTSKVFPNCGEFPPRFPVGGGNVGNAIAVAMLVLSLVASGPAFCQPSTNGDSDPHAYKTIPADEDWTFLADPALRSDFWDPIKYIPLREDAKNWYLSIGGQIREEWESVAKDGGSIPIQP